MGVELTRVDYRLIHGQVITNWMSFYNINKIVTIDDDLRNDSFMQDVFKMAAPKGVKIVIVSANEAVAAQSNGELDSGRVMLLLKNVQALKTAVDAGVQFTRVQIGGLGGAAGRKAVHGPITLDQRDLDTLLEIQATGVEIYFQTTTDYPVASLEKVAEKFNH
ncbi:PTS system mannose/fructose/N-acetylgalactosamine-transporter subunit IIB [Thermophilibacter immobilis]|uniref:PTS sugar transporter subunit IIB n=1 Tax=Thermophilibacter immobilis TaxID=2779519 RepID=A0A7S7M8F0_9ACTN|nr:PTS sugar transporter subunit IIB [Thermophilibacter immobilis]QOY60553.1 PTS sugar transporter subunit IIB [Thermophilibacter immobilis]